MTGGPEPLPPGVYTVAPGRPFGDVLARQLLREAQGAPEALAAMRILLPSRRACRSLRESFLRQSDGAPLILPRLQSLGDVDEEELSLLAISGEAADIVARLPAPMPPLRRQMLLARLIMGMPGAAGHYAQALQLAQALGNFLDQMHTEGLGPEGLADLVPEEFAAHWQISLQFLSIITERWPLILAEEGMIDEAARRVELLRAQTVFWRDHPPATSVIAAGSTGSIPATAALLGVVAGLPRGRVVLPGLDQGLDEESWRALGEDHPQYGFKALLGRLEWARETIRLWPDEEPADAEKTQSRIFLMREAMRPAASAHLWADLSSSAAARARIAQGCQDLTLYVSENEHEEAELIALLLREALEKPGHRAALVTPDRALARRVSAICARWKITVDDSAGYPFADSPLGLFLQLLVQACQERFAPVTLLALLKHPYARLGMDAQRFKQALLHLEKFVLRGIKPAPGLEGIRKKLLELSSDTIRIEIETFIERLETALTPLIFGSQGSSSLNFKELLKAHLRCAENLATGNDTLGSETLWAGEEGEQAAQFFAQLLTHHDAAELQNLQDYALALHALMQGVTLRSSYGAHPRLMILGQIEARLIQADTLIMGGLNEGVWPREPAHDPWMSRMMRRDFGLPSAQRETGLAAHDFAQGFCAPQVVMTCARRRQDVINLPSRWLRRLESVLQGAGLDWSATFSGPGLGWVRAMHFPERRAAFKRPAPRPPRAARPGALPVTAIDKLLRDPYSIYARYILGLKKLDDLEQEADQRFMGILLHEVLKSFAENYPGEIPQDARQILRGLAQDIFVRQGIDPASRGLWWPRFNRMIEAFLSHEASWRLQAQNMGHEIKGEITLELPERPFTLQARADRIDRSKTTGEGIVIDYKTGGVFTKKSLMNGQYSQLVLEALILQEGGFRGFKLPVRGAADFMLWMLHEPSRNFLCALDDKHKPLSEQLPAVKEKLAALLTAFEDPQTAYHPVPRPGFVLSYNDYEHLSRIGEWGVSDDPDTEWEAA